MRDRLPVRSESCFRFRGSYGRGAMTCRTGEHFTPLERPDDDGPRRRQRRISDWRPGHRLRPSRYERSRSHSILQSKVKLGR